MSPEYRVREGLILPSHVLEGTVKYIRRSPSNRHEHHSLNHFFQDWRMALRDFPLFAEKFKPGAGETMSARELFDAFCGELAQRGITFLRPPERIDF